ncbi:MAG: hypothetical protein ACYTAN_16775, partial [Planctomycetota bacterium]
MRNAVFPHLSNTLRGFTAVCAAAAAALLCAYVAGCRPAWHPSGKMVAFPYAETIEEPLPDLSGIAVWDSDTGTVKRLYEEDS